MAHTGRVQSSAIPHNIPASQGKDEDRLSEALQQQKLREAERSYPRQQAEIRSEDSPGAQGLGIRSSGSSLQHKSRHQEHFAENVATREQLQTWLVPHLQELHGLSAAGALTQMQVTRENNHEPSRAGKILTKLFHLLLRKLRLIAQTSIWSWIGSVWILHRPAPAMSCCFHAATIIACLPACLHHTH